MTTDADPRRAVPAVHELLDSPAVAGWIARWGREPVKKALQVASDEIRDGLARPDADGPGADVSERLLAEAHRALRSAERASLRGVLNATGVVIHTNLGRAPLAAVAAEAVREVATGYSNLEYDLDAGKRGSRYAHCADLIAELTGSEAALVVNNTAAAVALAVNALAWERDVVVSRGELVEIGGSFRIPDIVDRSGGRLRAVGTTNRTRLDDYRRVTGPDTGMLLKVHHSNYRIEGFVQAATLDELVELGRERGVPVVYDLGSALLNGAAGAANLPDTGLSGSDPTASVEAGAGLVMWSGDKLLGGPQAGIIHGSAELVGRLRASPLARAFRVDKMTLAALEATLHVCRDPERARSLVPVRRMLDESVDSVRARVEAALAAAPDGVRSVVEARRLTSVVGGGSLPGSRIGSRGIAVVGLDPTCIDAACRAGTPPLVGRIEQREFLLDFRTLAPGEETEALVVLETAIADCL